MKITRVFALRVELPLHERNDKWSGGNSVSVCDSLDMLPRAKADLAMDVTNLKISKPLSVESR